MTRERLLGTTSLSSSFALFDKPSNGIRPSASKTIIEPIPAAFEITLDPQERGIVLSNPLTISGTSVHIESSEIDSGELRRALLFWDKLVWPSTNGILIAGSPDIEFLESVGKMNRPHFHVNGDTATALSMAFAKTYQSLEDLHPGQWLVSRGEKSLKIHGQGVEQNRGIVTKFINAIPVPDRAMPLEDILNFKEQRYSEVIALRTAIDEFYQSWINSEDQTHQLQLVLAKIDSASSEMIKVARESLLPFSMSSWKINFNITAPDILKAAGLTLAGAVNLDLSLTSSLLAGGLSTVSFGSGIGLRRAKRDTPFNYIASLERDMF